MKSRQQMTCSLSFTSKVSLRKVSLREPPGGQILIRDICIAKYNGFFCCTNSTCFQKLNIIVYFLTCSYSVSFLKISDNTFENMRSRDIQIRKCEWAHGCKMAKSKSPIKNSKLFYMCVALLL